MGWKRNGRALEEPWKLLHPLSITTLHDLVVSFSAGGLVEATLYSIGKAKETKNLGGLGGLLGGTP